MICRGFLHYPPPYNPEYEAEPAWDDLEFEMEKAAADAVKFDHDAAVCVDSGRDALEDAAAAAWNRYNALKRQLADVESGW